MAFRGRQWSVRRVLVISQREAGRFTYASKRRCVDPGLFTVPRAADASFRYARPVKLATVSGEWRLRRTPTRISDAVPIAVADGVLSSRHPFRATSDVRQPARPSKQET